jgi:hypothetical protein
MKRTRESSDFLVQLHLHTSETNACKAVGYGAMRLPGLVGSVFELIATLRGGEGIIVENLDEPF